MYEGVDLIKMKNEQYHSSKLWEYVLFVEEAIPLRENNRNFTGHWQTLSH
jgi:hypothetical protein